MHLLLSASLLVGLADAPVATPYQLLEMDALVHLPAGTPFEATDFRRQRSALFAVAVRRELLSPDQVEWRLQEPDQFQVFLDEVRDLFRDTAGCPTLAELAWLPPSEHCVAVRRFHDGWEERMLEIVAWNPDWEPRYMEAIVEGRRIRAIYENADWATCQYVAVAQRRMHGRDLRAQIGQQAWDERRLPAPCVTWAFSPR